MSDPAGSSRPGGSGPPGPPGPSGAPPAAPPDEPSPAARRPGPTPSCDVCGSERTAWVRCKLVCLACHSIVMSCGDL